MLYDVKLHCIVFVVFNNVLAVDASKNLHPAVSNDTIGSDQVFIDLRSREGAVT